MCRDAEAADGFLSQPFIAFRSVAHDEAIDSNWDVLIVFDRPPSLLQMFRLQYRLRAVLNYHVDVGTPNGLKLRIGECERHELIADVGN